MQAIKQWLGLPELSTKDKIMALKTRDDELSAKLNKQFAELEDILLRSPSSDQ